MVGMVGREIPLKIGTNVVAGVRTKNLSWSGGSINLTTDEDAGFQVLHELSSEESISIAIDGITKSDQIRLIVLGGGARILTDVTLDFGTYILSCDFRISGYEEGMPYNDADTFSGTLESTGEWDFTEVT